MTGTGLLNRSGLAAAGNPGATFSYAGVVVHVSSTLHAPLEWLDHFLRPWFSSSAAVGTDPKEAEATVELVIGGDVSPGPELDGIGADLEEAPCFLLDGGFVRHPIVGRRGIQLLIADNDLGVTYEVQPGQVTIRAGSDSAGARVALMRVVREMAVSHARHSGLPLMHAAVASLRGGAIVICGPKRSGKTTLLLHTLSAPGTRFVANDRAVVVVESAGATALGMPTITALRADSIERFAHLASALREAPDRHWLTPNEAAAQSGRPWSDPSHPVDLAPARFCELIGVEVTREARLGALVFPSVDPSAEGIALRRLTAAETLTHLRASLVGATLDDRPLSVFCPTRTAGAGSTPDGAEEALVPLAQLPAYDARLGPDAYASAGLPETLLRHVA